MTNYPPATWRLLRTLPADGATNMAIDEAILYALADGLGRPTIRFYQWNPPCLSLGYNQKWTDVNQQACEQLGYSWTRRATGGKAILHTDELTYSLITTKDDPRIVGGILRSYSVLSHILLRGLHRLQVAAEQAEKRPQPRTKADRQGPVCFDTPGKYEIVWQGKKLIGSAQLRRKNIVLQHGTLPLRGRLNRILAVLNMSEEEQAHQATVLSQRATTLAEVMGRELSFEVVAQALQDSFAEELNLRLVEDPLTEHEIALSQQLHAERYANDEWNKRV